MVKLSEVQKSAREFSLGLDLKAFENRKGFSSTYLHILHKKATEHSRLEVRFNSQGAFKFSLFLKPSKSLLLGYSFRVKY
jgi:hypothetical protein